MKHYVWCFICGERSTGTEKGKAHWREHHPTQKAPTKECLQEAAEWLKTQYQGKNAPQKNILVMKPTEILKAVLELKLEGHMTKAVATATEAAQQGIENPSGRDRVTTRRQHNTSSERHTPRPSLISTTNEERATASRPQHSSRHTSEPRTPKAQDDHSKPPPAQTGDHTSNTTHRQHNQTEAVSPDSKRETTNEVRDSNIARLLEQISQKTPKSGRHEAATLTLVSHLRSRYRLEADVPKKILAQALGAWKDTTIKGPLKWLGPASTGDITTEVIMALRWERKQAVQRESEVECQSFLSKRQIKKLEESVKELQAEKADAENLIQDTRDQLEKNRLEECKSSETVSAMAAQLATAKRTARELREREEQARRREAKDVRQIRKLKEKGAKDDKLIDRLKEWGAKDDRRISQLEQKGAEDNKQISSLQSNLRATIEQNKSEATQPTAREDSTETKQIRTADGRPARDEHAKSSGKHARDRHAETVLFLAPTVQALQVAYDRLEVRPSGKSGHGVFTTDRIKEYIFIPIMGPRADGQTTSHLWIYVTKELQHLAAIDGRPRVKGTAAGHGAAITMMINQASGEQQVNVIFWGGGVLSLRSLAANEELLIDYGGAHSVEETSGPVRGRDDGTDPEGMKRKPSVHTATSFVAHYAEGRKGSWRGPADGRGPIVKLTHAGNAGQRARKGRPNQQTTNSTSGQGKRTAHLLPCEVPGCSSREWWTTCKGCGLHLCTHCCSQARNPPACEACKDTAVGKQATPGAAAAGQPVRGKEASSEDETNTDNSEDEDPRNRRKLRKR